MKVLGEPTASGRFNREEFGLGQARTGASRWRGCPLLDHDAAVSQQPAVAAQADDHDNAFPAGLPEA